MKVFKFFGEVKDEMQKVVWPKKEETIRLTAVVIIFTLIVGVYVGLLDFGLAKGLEFIVSK